MAKVSDALGKWVEGTDRICWNCKEKITNLEKGLGEYRRTWPGGKTQVLCLECHLGRPETFTSRKRP